MKFYRARTERRLLWSVRDNAGDWVKAKYSFCSQWAYVP